VSTLEDRARSLFSHAAGMRTLERACEALSSAGVAVMPLKGLWLQSCVYARPDLRPITDVDVLVPEAAFDRAVAALERAGFVARQGNASELALYAPGLELPLDLHRRLFMPGAFELPTRALFDRGSPATLGRARVVLPDPIDALCHLVGHLVKSRGRPDDRARILDFEQLEQRFALAPQRVAERLHAAGMARAARYAFHVLADEHAFFCAVLDALPADRTGTLLAHACARRSSEHAVGTSPFGALPGLLLERSLAAALRAAAYRIAAWPRDSSPHR
jgi:hypothetical protein